MDVLEFTPEWLARPAPAFQLFASPDNTLTGRTFGQEDIPSLGPSRTIAKRGTEVFVAVGNEIRWLDLSIAKQEWTDTHRERRSTKTSGPNTVDEDDALLSTRYKVLQAPIHDTIQQLILSPLENHLAIVTASTVHIGIIPETVHLAEEGNAPIRMKTFQLGPTTHVRSQPRVISALWHPLGVAGTCLVTVTLDAVIRVWNLDRNNRSSFSDPATTIDAKKLLFARSSNDDLSAVRLGHTRGFSLDSVAMDVAAARFGANYGDENVGWESMTLWIAMAEGDVYALCPLLPSQFVLETGVLTSLAVSAKAKAKNLELGSDFDAAVQKRYDEQTKWLGDIESSLSKDAFKSSESPSTKSGYRISETQSRVPQLQGPFQISADIQDSEILISDFYVTPASKVCKQDTIDKLMGQNLVCLLTQAGVAYILLHTRGIEPIWLPQSPESADQDLSDSQLYLLDAFEVVDEIADDDFDFPALSIDDSDPSNLLVTHSTGVWTISLSQPVQALIDELLSDVEQGAELRFRNVVNESTVSVRRIIDTTQDNTYYAASSSAACVVLKDSDLGHMILMSCGEQPFAVTLGTSTDRPSQSIPVDEPVRIKIEEEDELVVPPTIVEAPRPTFTVPSALFKSSRLDTLLDTDSLQKSLRREEIRMSSATLLFVTEAHRILSSETYELGVAASDIFRRCERLQAELREQIERVSEITGSVESLNDEDVDHTDGDGLRGRKRLDERVTKAKERQERLSERYEALNRKLSKCGSTFINEKEEAWNAEVAKLDGGLFGDEAQESRRYEQASQPPPFLGWAMLMDVIKAKRIARDLIAQAKQTQTQPPSTETNSTPSSRPSSKDSISSPGEMRGSTANLRRTRLRQVMSMLDRETALLDSAMEKMERLGLGELDEQT